MTDALLASAMRKIILEEPYPGQSIIIALRTGSILIDGLCRITPDEAEAIRSVRSEYDF